MLFKKDFLKYIDNEKNVDVISTELIDSSRWSLQYRRVFLYEDRFYETYFSRGATEQQDEHPYEYDEDEIECNEVFPIEKTIIVYEQKEN